MERREILPAGRPVANSRQALPRRRLRLQQTHVTSRLLPPTDVCKCVPKVRWQKSHRDEFPMETRLSLVHLYRCVCFRLLFFFYTI